MLTDRAKRETRKKQENQEKTGKPRKRIAVMRVQVKRKDPLSSLCKSESLSVLFKEKSEPLSCLKWKEQLSHFQRGDSHPLLCKEEGPT